MLNKSKKSAMEVSDRLAIDHPKEIDINSLIEEDKQLKDFIIELVSVYINEIDYEYVKRAKELIHGDD